MERFATSSSILNCSQPLQSFQASQNVTQVFKTFALTTKKTTEGDHTSTRVSLLENKVPRRVETKINTQDTSLAIFIPLLHDNFPLIPLGSSLYFLFKNFIRYAGVGLFSDYEVFLILFIALELKKVETL